MRTVEFRNFLNQNNAMRVRFDIERDVVLRFMVQLECLFEEQWHPVVRYDTAHGFAHRDLLRPGGESVKAELNVRHLNEGLTFAIEDLRQNWQKYRGRYEGWLKEGK